jgi:hypothetical protein
MLHPGLIYQNDDYGREYLRSFKAEWLTFMKKYYPEGNIEDQLNFTGWTSPFS